MLDEELNETCAHFRAVHMNSVIQQRKERYQARVIVFTAVQRGYYNYDLV